MPEHKKPRRKVYDLQSGDGLKNELKDFFIAALPWLATVLILAVFFAGRAAKKKDKKERGRQGEISMFAQNGKRDGQSQTAQNIRNAQRVSSDTGNACSDSGIGDGLCDSGTDARIKCLWNYVFFAEFVLRDQPGKSFGCGNLHLFVYI